MKRAFYYSSLILCFLLGATTSCSSSSDDNSSTPTPAATISVSPQSLSFDVEAGEQTVTVTASKEFSAYTSESWVTVTPNSGLSGTSKITVKVTENTTAGDARTAKVTVKSGTVTQEIAVTQAAPEESPIVCPIEGYTLVWNDEFDEGTTLDTKKWTHEVQSSGWVNSELQNYVSGQSPDGSRVTEIKDGHLNITCLKDKNGKIYSGRVYGNLNTGFTYGYFEACIKLPKGKGTWPAWWMMPANNNYTTNPWPGCGEIDIMEEVGVDANYVSSTIHCTKYNNGNTSTEHASKYVSTAESEFHVYGCEWTAEYLKFYVDNELYLTYKPSTQTKDYWPFNVAFYPILNLAWGGSWGGYKGVDESALPVTMEVEYVRIWQKK